jgi:hypothetical protein
VIGDVFESPYDHPGNEVPGVNRCVIHRKLMVDSTPIMRSPRHHRDMTDTAEHPTTPTPPAGPPPPQQVGRAERDDRGPSRVLQVLAWVGIVAGVVFIVAVVFFSGFFLGRHAGSPGYSHFGGHHGRGIHVFHHGGPGPMARWPGAPMGPMGPMNPGAPVTPPSTTIAPAPSTPHP